MNNDWLYVEKQMRLDVQIGAEPIQHKYFYVWQCRYCDAREVTTRLEPPQRLCKCRKGVSSKSQFEQGQWDMFVTITSAWYGKQYYFMQDNGIVYSRLSHNYMSVDDAYTEFIDAISEY